MCYGFRQKSAPLKQKNKKGEKCVQSSSKQQVAAVYGDKSWRGYSELEDVALLKLTRKDIEAVEMMAKSSHSSSRREGIPHSRLFKSTIHEYLAPSHIYHC